MFPSPLADKTVARIQDRRRGTENNTNRVKYSAKEYEKDVEELLERLFPFSAVSGLRLFSAATRLDRDWGVEMDNLLHFRLGGTDFVIVIEAKKQRIQPKNGKWIANYDNGEKCAKKQVNGHIRTLMEYLEPISREIDLRFVGIVCCLYDVKHQKDEGFKNSDLHLITIDQLPQLLESLFRLKESDRGDGAEVLRVSQSCFLDVLRLNIPVAELGHPELSSAIRYIDRCRRTLDLTLFQDFTPAPERWAINGSAGMGKSVLLGYAAAVLCSGHELGEFEGEKFLFKADKTFSRIGFNRSRQHGAVCIMAMSSKQLENVRAWFDIFVEKYQKLDQTGDVRFRQPEFILCRDAESVAAVTKRSAALLVDEAHDLPPFAAKEIANLHPEKNFYLVVACDRHQKLRLSGSDARIIEGIDFRGRSRRLRQIYRNPAPIYIASLAIMFRWFGKLGPKVIPTITELRDSFGFDVSTPPGGDLSLTMMSDAHPANSWCHTVATFPSADAAYAALNRERLGHREVLWVRFSEEDPDFDYELLRNVTYHNCRSIEAHKINDKYVKGQEYPIVVIEGFPSFMDRFEESGPRGELEEKMWAFRREVYLCASRATGFLYFICNTRTETPENVRTKEEIEDLVKAVSQPLDITTDGTKSWRIRITETGVKRSMDVFDDDLQQSEVQEKEEPSLPSIQTQEASSEKLVNEEPESVEITTPPQSRPQLSVSLAEPVTPRKLAAELGLKSFQVIADLMQIHVYTSIDKTLDLDDVKKICKMHSSDFKLITDDPVALSSEISGIMEEQVTDSTPITIIPNPSQIKTETIPPQTSSEITAPKKSQEKEETSLPSIRPLVSSSEKLVNEEPKDVEVTIAPQSTLHPPVLIAEPVTPRKLGAELGLKPFQVIADLMQIHVYTSIDKTLDIEDVKKVCKMHSRFFKLIKEEPAAIFSEIGADMLEQVTYTTPITIIPAPFKLKPETISQQTKPEILTPKSESAFKHKIVISGPMSVVDLAKELGLQHRDVMIHATRMGVYARGGSVLDIKTMTSIAARHGIGLELKTL